MFLLSTTEEGNDLSCVSAVGRLQLQLQLLKASSLFPDHFTPEEAPDTDLTQTIAQPGPTRISCRYKNRPPADWLPARCLTMLLHVCAVKLIRYGAYRVTEDES